MLQLNPFLLWPKNFTFAKSIEHAISKKALDMKKTHKLDQRNSLHYAIDQSNLGCFEPIGWLKPPKNAQNLKCLGLTNHFVIMTI